jgi:quinoprotein glucose dehydrogenase
MRLREIYRSVLALTPLVAGLLGLSMGVSAQSVQLGTKNGEWPSYAGDLKFYHYSPLDQINAGNFKDLEIAWRFKTDNLGSRPEYKLEGTPLMVNGVVYTTAGTRRDVIALDAATGEMLWVHGEHEGERAAASPRQLSGRGVAYWSDGKGDDRIIYITTGYRLVALNAKTGARISTFGDDGWVDMKKFAVYGSGQPIDLTTGEIGLHSPPTVTKSGIVLIGSAFREGGTPKTHNNTKGMVLAFDVRTGKKLWQFNDIPRPGQLGNDTWLDNSWAENGNAGVWTEISVDEDLGLAYLPVETPTSDFYGGHRPGNDLFGDSIVCVDLRTGKIKWYFQLVHHALYNMDIAAAPVLADINVDGKNIKAVAVTSKMAFMYLFDRETGKPIWPIVERPVPKGDVPGEWYSPTQPFPTKPLPYDYQGVTEENLVDFTPAIHADAQKIASHYKLGPVFTTPVVSKVEGPIAAFRSSGGVNWQGFAYDPETHIAYVPSATSLVPIGLLPSPSKEFSDIRYVEGDARTGVHYVPGPGENAGADAKPLTPSTNGSALAATRASLNPDGLSLVKPPYGRITAINFNTGDFVWQVPRGETPDAVRNNPALKGVNIPNTGQSGDVGVVVTKTLVIGGDPQVTTSTHPRGAMLRAYDKATGKVVGEVWMPAPQSGTPMTYSVNGKQYIIIAVGGGNYSSEYLAFSLPK